MKVREVMTKIVVTATPEMSFKETAELLLEYGVSGLPVVGAHNRLLGIVTEADLMSKEAFEPHRRRPLAALVGHLTGTAPWIDKASGLTAGEVMTTAVVTAQPGEEIGAAARLGRLVAQVSHLGVGTGEEEVHVPVGVVPPHAVGRRTVLAFDLDDLSGAIGLTEHVSLDHDHVADTSLHG